MIVIRLHQTAFVRGFPSFIRQKDNIMKSDLELRRDVLDELEWEPSIDAAEIGVTVHAGVVTLSGTAKTYS